MSNFKLSQRSLTNLEHVHPDLVKLVKLAIEITTIDFTVLEGLREPEKQKSLVSAGKSWTNNSRHLTGHAIDVGVIIDKRVSWDYPWYEKLYQFFDNASKELKIPMEWGGNWPQKDAGHYQLTWKDYPLR